MNRFAPAIAVLGTVILLSGCETTNSIPYKASTANIIMLQQQLTPLASKVGLSGMQMGEGVDENPMCRLMGPVKVAPGKTLTQYVQDAFQEELFMAGVYDPNAPAQLRGTITELSFSSFVPAAWNLGLTVHNTAGEHYSVAVKYPFDTSFTAVSACRNVADAFAPAVQALLTEVIRHPRFTELVKPN